MNNLAVARNYLSEEMTLLRFYVLSHKSMDVAERVAEIKGERALSKVIKNPNERTIEDALNYVGESDLVTLVREYLQRQMGDNQKKLSDYIEQLTQLDELKKQNGKLRGWQRSNVMGLEQEIDRHSELQTCYEYLLGTLNSKGPKAFAVEQERLKPAMFPYAVH